MHSRGRRPHLVVNQFYAEDAGGLATLAEGSLHPLLQQAGLDGPGHVVGVQGCNRLQT